VPGRIHRVHSELFRECREDLLEHVQLGPKGVQQHERRALARSDVAELRSSDIGVGDGEIGGPGETFGRHRLGPERLHDVGERDQRDEPARYEGKHRPKARRRSAVPSRPERTWMVRSRITTVAAPASSPVNSKWYVAARSPACSG
jgi:hypothetical protein